MCRRLPDPTKREGVHAFDSAIAGDDSLQTGVAQRARRVFALFQPFDLGMQDLLGESVAPHVAGDE